MADENFKIGIELEVDSGSLADIAKQVEKTVKAAFDKATAGAARGGSGAAPPGVPGGTATARSVREATRVTSRDFTEAVTKLARENQVTASRFDDAAASVVEALSRLTKAIESRSGGSTAAVAKAAADATSKLVGHQVGPSNKNLARDIQKSRQEAGRQAATSGGTSERKDNLRTGTRRDQPNASASADRKVAAREGRVGPHPLERHADAQAKVVAASLDRIGRTLTGLGKLGEIPDLLKKIGMPTGADVRVGQGASVEIKTLSGQAKTVTSSLRIVGDKLVDFTDIVTRRTQELLNAPDFMSGLQKAERTSRRDPERAVAMLRQQFKGLLDLPKATLGGAQSYQKAGEAMLEIDFSGNPELQERLSKLKDEAAQVALLNKELWNMTGALEELRKKGGQVMGSVGLSEEHAAKAQIIKGEGGKPIGAQIPVQLRDLAGMILGGRGAMRPARSSQPQQAREMIQGERPSIMGKGEAEAYETGMYKQNMTRTLRTAYVDPRQVPEAHEDMILLDKKAAEKMAMWEPKITQPIKTLAEDLQAGQKLIHGQLLGFNVEGEEIKFNLKGAQAEIESVEEVVENGIKGVRIRFKELYEMTTGSKMTTTAGFKGVVRVEENMANKYGLPEGTEAAITGHGAARRGVLSDPMKMMASQIAERANSEASKYWRQYNAGDPDYAATDATPSAQEVADRIEQGMQEGGQDLVAAVEAAAKFFSAAGFAGGGAAMTGDMPWMRLKEPRDPGAADIGSKYYDLPAIKSLGMRADTAKMAEDMMSRMATVTAKQGDFVATLQALAGASDVASENLRHMLPEEFKRLPPGVGAIEDFADTILDPRFKEALAIRLPSRGGEERLLRMPQMGKGLGARGSFETALGAKGSDPITRQFDQIIQQARQIRVAEGRATPGLGDLDSESESYKDAAFKTAEAIRVQVKEIQALGSTSTEGAAAAAKFVEVMLPLIQNMKLAEDISFYKLKAGGERAGTKPVVTGKAGTSAEEFVKGVEGPFAQMFRMQDVLRGRAATRNVGKGYENVPTTGAVFQNAEVLQKSMKRLGVTLEQDSVAVEKMYSRLEKLEEGLISSYSLLAFAGPGGSKKSSSSAMKIPYAAQIGSGLSTTQKELTAIQMRTDVDEELGKVYDTLMQLASAGRNVDEAMASLTAMANIQGNQAKIPRDAVFVNKQDWDNMVQATMKESGVDQAEAERRMARPGLLHRYPTTGGASFLASRPMVDPTGAIPPGKIGVPGPFAASSSEDLAKMLAPLREFEQSLYATIEANKGQGNASSRARAELENLLPVLQKLTQLYLASGLNLDFDGDKISFLGDTATAAGAGVETFTQKIERGGVSFQQMMANSLGKVAGGKAGNLAEYSDLFGKVAKGRSGDLKRSVLMPETGETAQFEAQAHIGGKKSVGLLTDAFNKIAVAVTVGTGSIGDSFATGMDYIMLNINKSLAQKSGGGGTAGPLELLDDLKGGKLEKIFKGMRSGDSGLYSEMGDYNKQMRDQMKESFTSTFLRKGGGGLQEIAKSEGIAGDLPKDITFENFRAVVDQMVNSLDLEAQITRMFEMMKKNMVKALQQQGMGMPEVEASMEKMFTPGKGGKVPGLNVDSLLQQLAPEYLSTRKAQVKGLKEAASPMEQAQEALRVVGRNIATEVEGVADGFNLEEAVDPKQKAREISQRLIAWYKSIKDTFQTVGRQEDFKRLTRGKIPDARLGGIGGLYTPGRTKVEPGRVHMSFENRIRPFLRALKSLDEISQGTTAATPEKLEEIATGIKAFGATLSHEKVHQASKFFQDAVNGIVRSLQTSSTAIGRDKDKLINALRPKANIGVLAAEYDKKKAVADTVGDQNIESLKKPQARLFKQMGEELLAYQTDPETFQKTMQAAGVSEEAISELSAALQKLVADATSAEETVADKDFMAASRGTRESVSEIRSLAQALAELGPASGSSSEAIQQVGEALAKMGNMKILQGINERLTQQEAAVVQGTGALGLPTITRKGGRMELGEDISKLGVEDKLGGLTTKIKGILEAARAGLPDLGALAGAERDLQGAANDLRAGVSQLERDKDSGVGRGTGHRLFQKVWREFHQAVSIGMINKARDLQRQIAEIESAPEGVKDPGKLRDLMNELTQTVIQHEEYLARSLKVRGGGRGTTTSHITNPAGELVPAAMEAGIKPSEDMLQANIQAIAGSGKEGAAFMKQMGSGIEFATSEMKQGKDITESWVGLMSALKEQPELFHTNLVKVAEILSRIATHVGFLNGKYSDSSTSLMEMTKHAKALARALEGKVIKNADDLNLALAGAPKQAKMAGAVGAGGTLGESIKQQYVEAESAAKSYQARIQSLINDQAAFSKLGRPKHFAPITKDIIDPNTGKVIQQVRIEIKRMGDTAVVSMKNATNATAMFGNQMRSALRRVVMWGMASGAIYGLVRGFRSMIDVVITVQTKMTELQKVMDTSITDFGKLQDAAVQMAKNSGVAIEDVLDGMVVYGQQGLKMGDIMERTKATLVAVNTTTLDSTEATEALTSAHKVFGNEVGTSLEFVDAWAAVAAKHAVSAEDLADAVKRSGSAASVAGVSFQDFLGIVTSIGSVTRQSGKEVATATKFMFRTMRSGGAQKQLGRMGIQSMDVTGDYRPAMDVLKEVAGTWGDLSRAQQVNLAQSISGIRHYNQFIVLMENFDEALLASADASNSQGFSMRKNALAMQTFAKEMQVLKETVKGLGLALGKSVLPVASLLVKGMTGVLDIISLLPTSVLTATTAFGALALAGAKTADIITDGMDAIVGQKTGDKIRDMGAVGVAGAAWGGMKDIGKGLSKTGDVAEYGSLASGAMKARNMVEGLGSSMLNLLPATSALAGGLDGASVAARLFAGATGIGLIIAAIGGLIYMYNQMERTGDDVAKDYEDLIGRSQDYATQLRSQASSITAVSQSFAKVSKAASKTKDLKGMKQAMDQGTYKSASVAAQKYGDVVNKVSETMGQLDPTRIRGISETGDLIMDLDDTVKGLTLSAIDAQNALTAAFQGKVIAAYTKDLSEAKGAAAKISQAFFSLIGMGKTAGGEEKFSLIGQMEELQDKMKLVIDQREQLLGQGFLAVGTEGKLNELTKERAELQAEILDITGKVKQTMDAMPRFEDMSMAAEAIGPDFFKAAGIAEKAGGGQFGRGASEKSIMFGAMARQAGLGGVVDYRTAESPSLLAGSLAEKGVKPTLGLRKEDQAGIKTGEIAVVGTEIAKKLSQSFGGTQMEARTLIAGVDETTGQAIYRWVNTLGDTYASISSEELGKIVDEVATDAGTHYETLKHGIIRFQKKAFEDAQEETEKLINMTFVGAMAGTRVPKGGMPDIGLATKGEMNAEQRTMAVEGMAVPLQRLADIQAEYNQLAKEYSEDILTDIEGAYARQAQNATALKILTSDMVDLVMQLQAEGFKISQITHYQKAIEELNVALDQAAKAARDARIEEETRAQFMIQTSGAMKGMAEMPSLDFGKTFKELSGMEKLSLEVPNFGGGVRRIASQERERESQVQLLTDIRKQRANFDDTVSSLEEAFQKMSGEQRQKAEERLGQGLTKDTIQAMAATEQANEQVQKIMQEQTGIEERQAETLDQILKVLAGGSKDKALSYLEEGKGQRSAQSALGAMGTQYGQAGVETSLFRTFGLRKSRQETELGKPETLVQTTGTLPPALANLPEEAKDRLMSLREQFAEALNVSEQVAGSVARGGADQYYLKAGGRQRKEIGTGSGNANQMMQEEVNRLQEELLAVPGVAGALADQIKEILSNAEARKELAGKSQDTHGADIAELDRQIAEKRSAAYSKFQEEELKAIASIEQTNKELGAKDTYRLAIAARDFATSLETMITDFKKTEALYYEKEGSDLEGAFSRVGQPGFKTTFEQRREELKAGGTRPMSLEQMQQRSKDLDQVNFDEKEAKIKEQQDVETGKLRTEQSQAEQFRQVLADALFSGQLEDTGLEGGVKNMMDTLTQELATSEQANVGPGGELTFAGIPALEDAVRMMQQAKSAAADKASEALGERDKKYITDPIVSELQRQTGMMSSGAGKGIAPVAQPGAVLTAGAASTAGAPALRTKEADPWAFKKSMHDPFEMTGDMGPGRPNLGELVKGSKGVYKGTARAYGTNKDENEFVQAQTIGGGGLTARDNLKTLMSINSKTPPTQMWESTGELAKSKMTPQSYLEALQRNKTEEFIPIPAQGISNRNLEENRRTRQWAGNADATGGNVTSTPATEDIAARAAAGTDDPSRSATGQAGDTEALASAIAALNEQFGTLVSALQGITEIGSKIDGTTAAVEALGEGMEVSVTGGTIEVSNLSSIADAINPAISSVGAQASEALRLATVLETVVGENSVPLGERFSELDTKINSVNDTLTTNLEATLAEAAEQAKAAASAVVTEETGALQSRLGELEKIQGELTGTKEAQEKLLTDIDKAIEETKKALEEADKNAKAAIDAVNNTQVQVASFDDRIIGAEEKVEALQLEVDAVTVLSNVAADTAKTANDTATSAKTSIQQETTLRENAARGLQSSIDTFDASGVARDDRITQVEKIAARADENAKSALNKPRGT